MNFKRLLNTPGGRFFISLILGLGLATFFRKVCKDKNCIVFHGPILSDFEDKVYKYGNKCYTYTTKSDKCDTNKKVLDIRSPPTDEEEKKTAAVMPKILTGASPIASGPPVSSTYFKIASL